jgi:SAM-dependent methyltransferase
MSVAKNRSFWNSISDSYQADHGSALEGEFALAWGAWRIPEAELGVLGSVAGRDVLELGCGAAQWTIELRNEGARVVGIDLSERQLAHARRAAPDVSLVHGSAETLPFRSESFDLVFCDHGAMTFAPPEKTVPEAARVLRTGGLFAFCISTPIRDVCFDPAREGVFPQLSADYFTLSSFEDGGSVEYQLPYGAWIRLFRRHGFAVEDLVELQPPAGAATSYSDFVPVEWARRWPAEHIWKVRKEC